MDELKPCPFCGSDDRASHRDGMRNWIECHNCHATGPTRITKEGASAAWNKCKLIAAAPDLLAACEALLTAMDEWSEDELSPVNQGARLALMAEARAAITKAHGDGS